MTQFPGTQLFLFEEKTISSLDCIITIEGRDGKYGRPASTRREPLRNFLVFNQHFFPIVRKHLKTCKVCDPRDALQVYYDRLDRVKNTLPVSQSVMKNALTFGRIWPELNDLVIQFMILCYDQNLVIQYLHKFDEVTLIKWFRTYLEYEMKKPYYRTIPPKLMGSGLKDALYDIEQALQSHAQDKKLSSNHEILSSILLLPHHEIQQASIDDLLKLARVGSVMCS